jgi:CheY-like chemotaxis protein
VAKATIVIVEDEAIVGADIQTTLERLGYDAPAIAVSGEEALKRIEEIGPDLVLMDIILQGEMDGIEVAAAIRGASNIPVVYLTAYMDEERLRRAKMVGPFAYIPKPFEEEELASTIEKALSKTPRES